MSEILYATLPGFLGGLATALVVTASAAAYRSVRSRFKRYGAAYRSVRSRLKL